MRKILILMVLGFFISIPSFGQSGITQITNNSYNDVDPQINSSGQVVWRGETYGKDFEIYLYNGI